jgi:bacterioferritin
MQAKEGVIDVLNSVLSAALPAINQYFIHAKICAHWGYARLHDKERARSMGVMRDADALLGRILYLEGVPKVQRMPAVPLGVRVPEQLRLDLKAAQEMLTLLNAGVRHCTTVADFTTRRLLEGMAKDADAHIEWLEMQMDTIEQGGLEPYLAEQIRADG